LEDKGIAYSVLVEIFGGKSHLEDLSIDGRIISKYILNKLDGRLWAGLFWHITEMSGGLY
jgi:hypothetical protein